MKKAISVLLAVFLLASIAACGDKPADSSSTGAGSPASSPADTPETSAGASNSPNTSLGAYNRTSLLRQIPAYAIMAVGLTVVFATGQMDMSAGSLLSMCTVMYAKWSFVMPVPIAVICAILLGAFVSMCTSSVLRAFNLNAFILTLAASQVIEGISGQITGGKNISGLSDAAKFLGQRTLESPVMQI